MGVSCGEIFWVAIKNNTRAPKILNYVAGALGPISWHLFFPTWIKCNMKH